MKCWLGLLPILTCELAMAAPLDGQHLIEPRDVIALEAGTWDAVIITTSQTPVTNPTMVTGVQINELRSGGLWMLNRMPQVMTLRAAPPRPAPVSSASSAGLIVRIVYFLLIGWWVSLLWMQLAWLAALLVIGLPLSFQMFERVGTVMTLADA